MAMNLLNKKSILIFTCASVFVLICCLQLFSKQEDYYEITINPKLLNLRSESLYENTKISKNEKKFGISLSVRKKFVSTYESKRMLLGGSMEKGINGIVNPINCIKMEIIYGNNQKMDVLNNLLSEDLKSPNKLYYDNSENSFYQERNSLAKFIEDINKGKPYTKGISFYDTNLFFVFDKEINRLLQLKDSKLYFEIQDQYGHIIRKRLK